MFAARQGTQRCKASSGLRKNSRRNNSPGNSESGNGEEQRRAAAIRKHYGRRTKDESFDAESYLKSGQREGGLDIAGGSLNLAVSDGNDGTIVIFRDGPAVKPGMKRWIRLSHSH
jgi:hypothetical protein